MRNENTNEGVGGFAAGFVAGPMIVKNIINPIFNALKIRTNGLLYKLFTSRVALGIIGHKLQKAVKQKRNQGKMNEAIILESVINPKAKQFVNENMLIGTGIGAGAGVGGAIIMKVILDLIGVDEGTPLYALLTSKLVLGAIGGAIGLISQVNQYEE